MANVHYVRGAMIEQLEPPAASSGAAGWVRQNLFSSPLNAILSVLSLALVYSVIAALIPWLISPTWQASSLSECREILEGASGACWGVIRERWLQLLFGFYPSELYWRVVLDFLLLIVAVAPVLFTGLPRKMLIFSALYPFLMPWLLWGGTVWGPVVAALGFGLGYLAHKLAKAALGGLAAMILAVLVPVIWWLFLAGPVSEAVASVLPLALEPVESRNFGGFMLSITIGVVAIAISLPIGIVLALGRQSNLFIVRSLSVGFIEFIRGVPLITLLFVASTLLNIFMPPGTDFDIILRVIIMVTLFASAYMAEVVRGGLAALPKGQYEAADALGLDFWLAQRLIIMPQALKISIPGIVSTFIGVFKDTTLVSIIGLLDPIGLSNSIRADQSWNGIVWELYGFIALMFFIFCFSMSRYSMFLERKLRTGHR
ncbi:amino acid ABC transporter permease [Tropicimonas sp. IMCC6043]|uniref:amino acid ABC transporter permease n=1 Tax=Tropicimonas sp. IMCC6043 TaxID=2510645 RepID=UPI00101C4787|nr:amino acid ABC transporter permease [Tropicimonas sp. IMCC6043]RYH08965.1 amino acid ABC transporter permease [Tropicimonas sp. IMCC6043]